MHIKLVANSFPAASETFLFNLVTGLEKRGVKVTVCASARTKDMGLYAHRMKHWSGNIQYISFKPKSISNIIQITKLVTLNPIFLSKAIQARGIREGFKYFIKLKSLLKGTPDIVHFSFSGLGISYLECLPHLQKLLIKTVVSCRGTAEKVKPLLEPERRKKLQLLFSQVDLVHCVSKDMMESLLALGLTHGKAFVNYPSIDPSNFKRTDPIPIDNKPVKDIVTTGNLNFAKGYIFALQAMKILKERGLKFRYHILGDGPDRAMITFTIHEFGLTNEVILHGRVSSLEVVQQLNQADIFLLPSVYEGLANAALEAMAMEIPLVTTKAGGMSEVVQHKQNGMLVECFNGLAIADGIGELLLSPELRINMAKVGRETVEKKFKLENQIDIFLHQYKIILGSTSTKLH